MRQDLVDLLADPISKAPLTLVDPIVSEGEITAGRLTSSEWPSGYMIESGVPRFIDAKKSYGAASDPRAKWKNALRKSPGLTRTLQFIFDPAHVVSSARKKLTKLLPKNSVVLNIGAGVKKWPNLRCINLDLDVYGNVDVIANAQALPFKDASVDAVVLEYVLEHVPDSTLILSELRRVLKPGGYIYATVPFMQAYHGNPDDYYRFTVNGFKQFLKNFDCVECTPFGGPTSAFVCTTKEFLAILFSFNSKFLYSVLSQLLIIPFFPLKYLDALLVKSPNAHNLAFSIQYLGMKNG